ncbi:uncharacterized protein C11orf52 homolog isoform X2 [Mauremys reevesii]|uniref:uncharacterized protein C11orf52 homolog isoform X2 n=1 Tax=Mauremys reevesii TaxID=260615 RepID=UPI00193EDFB0|nr:uncharacterized protein C11orf52 homolog isoform X2 [Mauremys reevesii]
MPQQAKGEARWASRSELGPADSLRITPACRLAAKLHPSTKEGKQNRRCPSPFKRKKEKQGTRAKQMSHPHQDDRKGLQAAHTYDDVSEFPVYATVNKPRNVKRDDSVHYADIQVFTRARERSAQEVKNLQMQNATEYATLNFPHPRLKYDSRNGTLV